MDEEQKNNIKDIYISTCVHDEFTGLVRKVASSAARMYAKELEKMIPSFVEDRFARGVIEGIITFSDVIAERTIKELIKSGYIKKA